MVRKKIQIYDTTLRDGAQAEGVSLSVEDKLRLTRCLDDLGVDYIEGGWPGSNPKDNEFFARMRGVKLKRAKLCAFGSTRRLDAAGADTIFTAMLEAGTATICLFGKTWDLHVRRALHMELADNLELIRSSVAFFKKRRKRVFFDAEHFFDGFKANPRYALLCLKAAATAGADMLILCDTNGGSLPDEIHKIVGAVKRRFRVPLGIHCHNDTEMAVANSLAAVRAGAVQVQGTMNGIGERCGNANLASVMANLELKQGMRTIGSKAMQHLSEASHFFDQIINRVPNRQQAYVGESAFAHKGGVHVSAVMRDSQTYEHIDPKLVGNCQRILLSDYSGKATIVTKLKSLGVKLAHPIDEHKLLATLKDYESRGYQFEDAEASFAMLVYRSQKDFTPFFELIEFRVVDVVGPKSGGAPESEARVELRVADSVSTTTVRGVGPVNALDQALRGALGRFYPHLEGIRLVDYKVRVLASGQGTESVVRVHIEFASDLRVWSTVGVSPNIIQASYAALVDGIEYHLTTAKSAA